LGGVMGLPTRVEAVKVARLRFQEGLLR
jgi:hypothetical protein